MLHVLREAVAPPLRGHHSETVVVRALEVHGTGVLHLVDGCDEALAIDLRIRSSVTMNSGAVREFFT